MKLTDLDVRDPASEEAAAWVNGAGSWFVVYDAPTRDAVARYITAAMAEERRRNRRTPSTPKTAKVSP